MQPKEILREHIGKVATLTEDQFDYFFSWSKPQSYKKGQTMIAEAEWVKHEYRRTDLYRF